MHFSKVRIQAALITLCILGCNGTTESGSQFVPVHGVVTFNGQPVDGASVVLHPTSSGKAAFGVTDHLGRYSVSTREGGVGALPGEYKVTIEKYRSGPTVTSKERYANLERSGTKTPLPEVKRSLPPKYEAAESTDLQVVVEPGNEKVCNFRLEGQVN